MNLKKYFDRGAYAAVGLHFLCCGLPLIAALSGGAASFLKIPHALMTWLLAISGLALSASAIMEIKNCECGGRRRRIGLLAACALMYCIGLAGHFNLISVNGQPVESCH